MTIGMPDEEVRLTELADAISPRGERHMRISGMLLTNTCADSIDDAMVFCQACRHGGHSGHILDWFFGGAQGKAHLSCAVADCDCRCAELI